MNIRDLNDLKSFAVAANIKLGPGSIILLSGDLGAGKTTFVSVFCGLHNISLVQSPTYALHNRYSGEVIVDHFDLYRLQTNDEIEGAGFFDLLNEKSDFCFIEWPERISKSDLPANRQIFEIQFKLNSDGTRDLKFDRLN